MATETTPAQPAPGPPLPPGAFPWVPHGKDPETYDIERVTALLKSAAYFPIFNISNPATPNRPNLLLPGLSFLITSVDVNEQLHRFEVSVSEPDCGACIKAAKRVGEPVASVHIRWTPIPDYFEASPGVEPPTWLLNPFVSQRFCMMQGQLSFSDRQQSGFRAFGTGRTFPVKEGGKDRLRIGAVINVLEGLGTLKDLPCTMCINGYIEPPNSLALNLVVRAMDPSGRLKARSPLQKVRPIADPDPGAVFMMFLGEVDPSQPVQLIPSPDGKSFIGSQVTELLRLVEFEFDVATLKDLRSVTREGPIVGNVRARLYFNMLDPAPVVPIQTTDGVFTFLDRKGTTIGTVSANMVEGRAIRTQIPGFPMPLFRFGGFGPVVGGTGQFSNANGMMSMNSAVSVFPRTLSNLYIFRFYDPQGQLRANWADLCR